MQKAKAYTDGSYNSTVGCYGCGMVLIDEDGKELMRKHKTGWPDGRGDGWNINGEIEAALMAVQAALELGCEELVICHDYEGVGKWPDGVWKAKKPYTQDYAREINKLRKKIQIRFAHVKGHSGNCWNEIADQEAGIGANIDTVSSKQAYKEKDNNSEICKDTNCAGTGRVSIEHLEGLNAPCVRALWHFSKISKPSFKDFAALRTGGMDAFSRMPVADMEECIGEEDTKFIRTRVNQEKDYASALRWKMRGLSADDAAHKVNVDREISENAKY